MAYRREIKSKEGFTLIELMVVVAIIGILAVIWSNINFGKMTDNEKGGQFLSAASSLIRTEVMHTIAGKSIAQSWALIYPGTTRISVSPTLISVGYYSGSTLLKNWPRLESPFFGDRNYTIREIRTENGAASYTLTWSDIATIELVDWKDTIMSYSGATSWNAIILEIDLGYRGTFETLVYDKRSNVVRKK